MLARRLLVGLAWLYFAGLGCWFLSWLLIGDRSALTFSINALALYLFLPVILIAPLALIARRWELLTPVLLALAFCAYTWGVLFLPGRGDPGATEPRLSVMTYNVLGVNGRPESVIETIRDSDADIVGL